MARNGKRVLAIVLSMALLITTLTSALIGLVGSADSASGSGAGAKTEGIINIPLYDANYTYKGPAQQGSGDTELVIASAAYWETLITLNKAYDLHAAQYADIQVSATEHYNDGDKLNITFSNGATYAVDTADLKVGELNTVRLQMDAALDWYAVNSITLSVTGEGAALAEDAQYGFAALNFYTKRISLGDVTDANLDGSVDVYGKMPISDYFIEANDNDLYKFFHVWNLPGRVNINLENYQGDIESSADVQNGADPTTLTTNGRNSLSTIEGKGAYQWGGAFKESIVSRYWKVGKNLSAKNISVDIYVEKEVDANTIGEIWVEFSSFPTAQHNWNLGDDANNTTRGYLIALKSLKQGWNTVVLDYDFASGRSGMPVPGTNVYGYYTHDNFAQGSADVYTGADGVASDGYWLYGRTADGKVGGGNRLFRGAGTSHNEKDVHNFNIIMNGTDSAKVGTIAIGQVGVLENGNDNSGYLLTGDSSEYNTFFWAWGYVADCTNRLSVQQWCDLHGYTVSDNVQPNVAANTNFTTNTYKALKHDLSYGDATRGYYKLADTTQGLAKYFGTPVSLSGSNINAWVYVDPNEELVATKTLKIRFSSYDKALHDHNVFDQAYAAYTIIPSTDLKAGWNLVTINPNATAKVGNVYGVTKGANYDSSRIYNLVVNRPGSTAWTYNTGIGAIYEVDKAAKSTITAASGNLNKTFNASNSTYMAVDITLPANSMLSAQDFVTVSLGAKDKGNDGANDMRWNVPVSQLTAGATTTVKLSLLSPEEVYPMRGYTTADLNDGTVVPYDVSWLAAIDSIAVSATRIGVIAANDALVTIGNITFIDDFMESGVQKDETGTYTGSHYFKRLQNFEDAFSGTMASANLGKHTEVAFYAKDVYHQNTKVDNTDPQYMRTIIRANANDILSFSVYSTTTQTIQFCVQMMSGAVGVDIESTYDPTKTPYQKVDNVMYHPDGSVSPNGTTKRYNWAGNVNLVANEWVEIRIPMSNVANAGVDVEAINFFRFFANAAPTDGYHLDNVRLLKADSIQADTSKVLKLRQGADATTYDASRNLAITATREDGTTYAVTNNASCVSYDVSQVNTAELGTYPVIVTYNDGLADLTTKVDVEVVADKQYLIEAVPGETMVSGTYDPTVEGAFGDGTGGAYSKVSSNWNVVMAQKVLDVPVSVAEYSHIRFWLYVQDPAKMAQFCFDIASNPAGATPTERKEKEYDLNKYPLKAGWNLVTLDLRQNEGYQNHALWGVDTISYIKLFGHASGTTVKLGPVWLDTPVSLSADVSAFPAIEKGTHLGAVDWSPIKGVLHFEDGTQANISRTIAGLACAPDFDTAKVGYQKLNFTYNNNVTPVLTCSAYVEVTDAGKVYLFNGWNIGGSGQVTKKNVSDSNGVTYYANQVNTIDASAEQGTKDQWIVFGAFTATDLTSADTLHILMYANEGTATGYYLDLTSSGSLANVNNNRIAWDLTSLVQKTGVWHEIVLDLHTGKAYSSSAGAWTTPVDGTTGTAVIPDFSAMNYMRLYALNNTTDQPAVARIWIENDSMDSYDLIDGESYEKVKHDTNVTLFGQFNGKNAYKWNSATNGTYFKKYLAPISMETTELLEAEFYVEDLDAFTSAEIVLTSSKAAGTGTRTFTITKDMLSNDGWNTVYINYADGVDAGKFDSKMVQVIEVKSTVTAAMDLAIAKLTMYTDNARTTEWAKVENGHQATFTKGEGTITPVLPHEWTEWTTEHTNHGDEKHRECKVCGYIEKAAVEDGEGANGPSVTDEWDRLQETDNSLVFKGSWTSVQYGIFTDGRAFRTSSPSATLSFTFNGTALQINSYSSPTQGSFDVVITDASGNVVKSATYSMKEDEYRIDRPETKTMVGWCSAIIVDLETEGEYTALITANGDGFLWIDAVDVLGEITAPTETLQQVTVQESEFHGNASTDWQDLHLYQFSGEHALRTKVGGATLSLTFTGTQSVDLISYLSTSHGAVTVTLTDSTDTPVDTQYVDLTMGATGVDSNYQRSIFTKSGLDEAETYTITVTNAIDGKWCLVDAVILCGTNPYH